MNQRFARKTKEQIHPDLWSAKRELAQRILGRRSRTRASDRAAYVARVDDEHNVVGVGVGRKYCAGKGTPHYGVRVYVRRKLPPSRLGKAAIPKTISGIPTDVFEAGAFHALADSLTLARQRFRPVRPGTSIGFVDGGHLVAGTVTAIVQRDGTNYLLSNNHVLAFENRLPVGSDIIQPGTLDDGQDPGDRVGTLAQFIPLAADGNTVDAALASIDAAVDDTSRFPFRIRLASADPVPAKAEMPLAKLGRGSGYTEGQIDDLGIDVDVDFDTGSFSFVDQLLIKSTSGAFATLGDSGALVVLTGAAMRPVAMLFAASPEYALATPIDRVLAALNVTIVP